MLMKLISTIMFVDITRLVADNFDLSGKARIQSTKHFNQSLHWTDQYAVQDRVPTDVNLEQNDLQCRLEDLEMIKLLPNGHVQQFL